MPTEAAPAKINLALHVTGRRRDGYHLLDSLVVFAEVGDRVTLEPGAASLTVTGPFAAGLDAGEDNLCLRALRLAGAEARITLEKRLPVASGIGGGSADAAAVLRGLARMGHPLPDRLERLGADVPVCLAGRATRMRGTGEILDPVPDLPPLAMVLANPGTPLSTPAVFAGLARTDNPGLPAIPAFPDAATLAAWLHTCRNDLEPPALALAPQIGAVLEALRGTGSALARMSGSGATCFGLYASPRAAEAAAARIAATEPGWWVTATGLAPAPARG
ncbi:4-(cytidine 5'-diphospho)-2-C-methyl-D-erythritol kinase [Paracoccus sp. S-4012]|uniref:4-(cytidine 5'-diphospho)-2-C-methyl-D-erythritol kinase n=1 Tax=Paracoccus sp. S-4012 TaxID=2665648 RepID=UPI0012B0C70E|nr:4-(cytidine 5'-diphospho)-2-C-methyl-D-erythritol kinase [Paracoccus sp. S-4012]MRX49755.1 4-(cytidine 5'-diphospho)-2-C-methyl-D-erythritol kinase [Paracoccus sp. S-4012]